MHPITLNDTHRLCRTPLEEMGPWQRPLLHNTQHSQQTDIHACRGIQTGNPSKRAAVGVANGIGCKH